MLTGGPAPATVRDMLDRRLMALTADDATVARMRETLQAAQDGVFAEARTLAMAE
ncbi:MAG: hypothetical protein JOY66_06665 [Acetobacteraceae bacterium]|nr:hypothetical protein [Acetobacteraceae bacterium]